ncbi:MAG: hypothetical protein ACYTAF_01610 [Planctomycetota bacterium]|jgi:hypothetical protein
MHTYAKKGQFSVELPDSWVADEGQDPPALYDPDGVGVIHAGVQEIGLKKGERLDPFLFLRAFVHQASVRFDEEEAERFQREGLEGATYEFTSHSEGGKVRERLWFITDGQVLLFLTYVCPADERDTQREIVDGIVKSVRLSP